MEKLEVSNKAVVKVYLKSSPTTGSLDSEMQGGGGAPSPAPPLTGQPQAAKYFFNVGSVDSFERKMEEAQEALGIPLGDEVPLPPPPPTHHTHTHGAPVCLTCSSAGRIVNQHEYRFCHMFAACLPYAGGSPEVVRLPCAPRAHFSGTAAAGAHQVRE